VTITRGFTRHAEGSVLMEVGDTKVICTVSVEDRVPQFLKGKGEGWITSEYGMLPRATTTRTQRESTKGSPSGRTQEIQRLIGRSLRAVVDMKALGERTLWVDCDVIQADGGTRTASITGAFVAPGGRSALHAGARDVHRAAAARFIAATSVGKVGPQMLLDLAYEEDSMADVDMNIVKTGRGRFVEIQGTAEKTPFDDQEMGSAPGARREGRAGPGQAPAQSPGRRRPQEGKVARRSRSRRNALPRWLTGAFCSGSTSPNVLPNAG